jgi:hypothetical protein
VAATSAGPATRRSGAVRDRGRPAPTVDVVLPVSDERGPLDRPLPPATAFAAVHPEHHVTFVDDGPTDGTADAIRAHLAAASLSNVELVSSRPRGGNGHAVGPGIA